MAISTLLDRMQARGIVERREVAGDRRAWAVYLTADGNALVKRMHRIAAVVLEQVFTGTSAADRKRLFVLLETIKTNAARAAREAKR